jgi:hypothetical protein
VREISLDDDGLEVLAGHGHRAVVGAVEGPHQLQEVVLESAFIEPLSETSGG